MRTIIASPCGRLAEPVLGTRMRFRLRRRMFLGIGFFETSVALAPTLMGGWSTLSTSMVLWAMGLGGFGASYFVGRHRWLFLRGPSGHVV